MNNMPSTLSPANQAIVNNYVAKHNAQLDKLKAIDNYRN